MKRKFIAWGILAVVLVVALLAMFAVPIMTTPDVAVGIAGESLAAETADLAIIDSEAVLIIENTGPAPVSAMEVSIWLTLGVILVTTTIACRRRLNYLRQNLVVMSLHKSSISASDEVGMAGGPNKFISPVAA